MRASASWVGSVAGTPAGLSRPASCAPCPGAGRRSSPLPAHSSLPPSPPGEPADIRPPCTSVAPSMGSATTLWKMAGGTVFNRRMSVGQPAHMAHFISADYRPTRPLSALLLISPAHRRPRRRGPRSWSSSTTRSPHTHFLRVAREEMRAAGETVPLWVSNREAIDALGPLGRAWRAPTDWESPQGSCPLNER